MKREGYLFERVIDRENLRLAFWKAQRRKASKASVVEFGRDLDRNLDEIRRAFASGDYGIGHYVKFPIFDPKERVISAAPFRDRVMHHAVMNVCEPFFERRQIFDSYACRKGKGMDACLGRAFGFCAKYRWYLKMDVHKYFDSIPHDRLKALMARYFKDGRILDFLCAVIDSYETTLGRGIPIGNLTSQFFANAYLGLLDHYLKEELRVPGYVRYMDDLVVFSDDVEELKRTRGLVRSYCADRLGLEMNPPGMNRCAEGVRFLGYVVSDGRIRLSLRSKRRFARRIAEADRTEDQALAQSLTAFTLRADAAGFRRKTIFGAAAAGSNRVNRGGSWNNDAGNCRSANRDRNDPGNRNNNLGFRVALVPSTRTGRMPVHGQAAAPVAAERHGETNNGPQTGRRRGRPLERLGGHLLENEKCKV